LIDKAVADEIENNVNNGASKHIVGVKRLSNEIFDLE